MSKPFSAMCECGHRKADHYHGLGICRPLAWALTDKEIDRLFRTGDSPCPCSRFRERKEAAA